MSKDKSDMHYAPYHVSVKNLKRWAAAAKTPEEKRQYTRDIGKKYDNPRRGK